MLSASIGHHHRRRSLDERRRDPIWSVLSRQGRSYAWLARKTGYRHNTIQAIACGVRGASADFRTKCAEALDIPEELLFHEDGASVEVAAST